MIGAMLDAEESWGYLCIGALIFLIFSLVNTEEIKVGGKKIVVSAGDIEKLHANWTKMRNRAPPEKEMEGLVASHIREEVYYREALALGLDQDDTVIRRRIPHFCPVGMEFLYISGRDYNLFPSNFDFFRVDQ